MRAKMIQKTATDVAMTIALLFLMTYELIGAATHEWIGMAMFIMFLLHHILNWQWCKHLFKGRYSAFRSFQTVLVVFVLLTMIGSMVSGIILSRHVFAFLPINGGQSWARTLHLLCAYWGFVLMSLHLGLHWSMMMGRASRMFQDLSKLRAAIVRCVGIGIAIYGIFAFAKRGIGSYLLIQNQFVFFDMEEPLMVFFLDYLAIMGMFVFIGHYLGKALKLIGSRK